MKSRRPFFSPWGRRERVAGASRRSVAPSREDAQDSIMASDGADMAKGSASSNFAPAKKDAASELAAKTVGLVTKAEFTRVREEREVSIIGEGAGESHWNLTGHTVTAVQVRILA